MLSKDVKCPSGCLNLQIPEDNNEDMTSVSSMLVKTQTTGYGAHSARDDTAKTHTTKLTQENSFLITVAEVSCHFFYLAFSVTLHSG